MKKNTFKYFVCICVLISISINTINTFAITPYSESSGIESSNGNAEDGPQEDDETYVPPPVSPVNKQTELQGQIGEWDPSLWEEDGFTFEGITDVEGNIPGDIDYYTISVTVPLSMEFTVLPSTYSVRGSFYSPIYKIKNNGSKEINVEVTSVNMDETIDFGKDCARLWIEKINHNDSKTQLELSLCGIEDLVFDKVVNSIDLTNLENMSKQDRILYSLKQNETKRLKFASKAWELPENVEGKTKAKTEFELGLTFSIKN